MVLPRRSRRLPHRLQRRLRARVRPGQATLSFRDRRPAARRSGVEWGQSVFRPVGLRLRSHATTNSTERGEDMSSIRNLRKSVLCIAMGVCLSSIAIAPALAQSATGAVAGRADAGTQVTVTSAATGLTRTVTVNADGSYRLSQLPVGDYQLQVMRGGQAVGSPVSVNVALGGTTTVNLGSGGNVVNLDSIQVIGSRVINRVDVHSTESATNVTREEIQRVPVDQSLGSVALLAPGVIGGNSSFGGISFGGSSVAENSVFINGLN